MTHTPGPWTLNKRKRRKDGWHGGKGFHKWISAEGRYHNIVTIWFPWSMNENEHEANARLIAAAPQLLEALEFYANVAIVEDDGGMRARQAIALVEGDKDVD